MGSCKVVIDAKVCFFWAFLLLVLPLKWLMGFFLAAVVHELCHYVVLRAFRIPVVGLRIGVSGMKMEIPELSPMQELLCALAGPAGGLLLLLFGKWYPELAVCALIQSCYNLLPIYPLDGGRGVRSLIQMIVPQYAQRIFAGMEILVLAGILLCGMFLKWSSMAIIAAGFLVMKMCSGKIPCKHTYLGVQ